MDEQTPYMESRPLDAGKELSIFDDQILYRHREALYDFIISSKYELGWSDNNVIENQSKKYLHSVWSLEDFHNSGMPSYLENTQVGQYLEGYVPSKVVINLSIPTNQHYPHTHKKGSLVLLYYANMSWMPDFGGETLFYDEILYNIDQAIMYVPGRFVLFPGETPHALKPQTIAAPDYRFTMSMFYEKSTTPIHF